MTDNEILRPSQHSALLDELHSGHAYKFSEWPNPSVPKIAAGVYTIWEKDCFIYVGMSGRAMTSEHIVSPPDEPKKAKGLWTRLNSHAMGRRSGDQFCVYVCDRFVVPRLTADQQADIGAGVLSLDAMTKKYIHDRFSYRFVALADGMAALALEREVQKGALQVGRPMLNPL